MNLSTFSCCFVLTIQIFLFSCRNENGQAKDEKHPSGGKEATAHFKIQKAENYSILTVNSPYVGSNLQEKYVLYQRGTPVPDLPEVTHYIPVPVNQLAIHSTTHLGFLAALNQSDQISAATNLELYFHPAFNQRIKEGKVNSIGYEVVEQELLIDDASELLFSYAVDVQDIKSIEGLRKLGQKVILISEYMEKDPLLKASWIQVMALFFDGKTQNRADSIFKAVQANYRQLRQKANQYQDQPKVMIGFPWKGSWFVSGGDSFQAKLIEDAGGKYIWSDHKQSGGIPLSIEQVIDDALKADYWINPGNQKSFSEMSKQNQLIQQFRAYQNHAVYHHYKRSNAGGANDYWERGVVRPDLILADLIRIFHSDSTSVGELYFYQKLAP
mgnify:CR=1 FL=1